MPIQICEKVLIVLPHAGQDRVQTASSLSQSTQHCKYFTHKDIKRLIKTDIHNARHISSCALLALVNINVWYKWGISFKKTTEQIFLGFSYWGVTLKVLLWRLLGYECWVTTQTFTFWKRLHREYYSFSDSLYLFHHGTNSRLCHL